MQQDPFGLVTKGMWQHHKYNGAKEGVEQASKDYTRLDWSCA